MQILLRLKLSLAGKYFSMSKECVHEMSTTICPNSAALVSLSSVQVSVNITDLRCGQLSIVVCGAICFESRLPCYCKLVNTAVSACKFAYLRAVVSSKIIPFQRVLAYCRLRHTFYSTPKPATKQVLRGSALRHELKPQIKSGKTRSTVFVQSLTHHRPLHNANIKIAGTGTPL